MDYVYDYSRLRGDIKAVFKTQQNFAKSMGFTSQNSLSDRFSGKVNWKQSEMVRACKLLGQPLKMVEPYFFTYEVRKQEQKGGAWKI